MGVMGPIDSAINLGLGIGQLVQGKKNRKAASEEAQKTRDWQTSERESAQEFQRQSTRENIDLQKAKEAYDYEHYLSPAARMAALREAGLNPDLMYQGAAASGLMESPVVSPSSPSTPSGVVADVRAGDSLISSGAQQAGRAISAAAEYDLKRSEIDKNKSIVTYNGAQVDLTDSLISLNNEEKKKIIQQYNNMALEAGKIKAETDNILSSTQFLNASTSEKIQAVDEMKKTFNTRFDTMLITQKDALASLGLKEEDLKFLKKSLNDRLDALKFARNLSDYESRIAEQNWKFSQEMQKVGDNEYKSYARIIYETTVAQLEANNGLLETQLDLQTNYGAAHAISTIVGEAIGALTGAAAGAFFGIKGAGMLKKRPSVRGFGR